MIHKLSTLFSLCVNDSSQTIMSMLQKLSNSNGATLPCVELIDQRQVRDSSRISQRLPRSNNATPRLTQQRPYRIMDHDSLFNHQPDVQAPLAEARTHFPYPTVIHSTAQNTVLNALARDPSATRTAIPLLIFIHKW